MLKLEKPLKYLRLFFIIFILIRIIAAYTNFADSIFPGINYFITKITGSISIIFPFSLGDALYALLGILLLVFIVQIIKGILSKNWSKIKKTTSIFLIGLILIMLVFHFSWGFNYYKTPLKERYDTEEISIEELKLLAQFYLNQSVKNRQGLPEDENGVYRTSLSEKSLTREILNSSVEIQKINELKLREVTHPNLKKSLYSEAFSYMGVLGYYNPFTSEAQFNSKMPDTKLLFTKFHEVAHQWGFAPESEANFVGFLIGLKSENKEFNYVSNYKALRSLLSKIVWEDPAYVEFMLNNYSPAMKRDRNYEIETQKKYLNSADDAFSMLNDAYLQLNNQDGLESYGQFVELLVGYHRHYKP